MENRGNQWKQGKRQEMQEDQWKNKNNKGKTMQGKWWKTIENARKTWGTCRKTNGKKENKGKTMRGKWWKTIENARKQRKTGKHQPERKTNTITIKSQMKSSPIFVHQSPNLIPIINFEIFFRSKKVINKQMIQTWSNNVIPLIFGSNNVVQNHQTKQSSSKKDPKIIPKPSNLLQKGVFLPGLSPMRWCILPMTNSCGTGATGPPRPRPPLWTHMSPRRVNVYCRWVNEPRNVWKSMKILPKNIKKQQKTYKKPAKSCRFYWIWLNLYMQYKDLRWDLGKSPKVGTWMHKCLDVSCKVRSSSDTLLWVDWVGRSSFFLGTCGGFLVLDIHKNDPIWSNLQVPSYFANYHIQLPYLNRGTPYSWLCCLELQFREWMSNRAVCNEPILRAKNHKAWHGTPCVTTGCRICPPWLRVWKGFSQLTASPCRTCYDAKTTFSCFWWSKNRLSLGVGFVIGSWIVVSLIFWVVLYICVYICGQVWPCNWCLLWGVWCWTDLGCNVQEQLDCLCSLCNYDILDYSCMLVKLRIGQIHTT